MKSASREALPMGVLLANATKEINSFIENNPEIDAKQDFRENLSAVIPDQKVGPYQFEFTNNILKIKHSVSEAAEKDKLSAQNAKSSIISQGEWLKRHLIETNADPRVVSLISELQSKLESNSDVIDLGITSIVCDEALRNYKDELPSHISGKIEGYSLSIAMYVAQFPEWIRFSENAAIAEYNAEDISTIYKAGMEFVDSLKLSGSSVDPEVPRTLKWLLEAIKDPRTSVRRTVFGAMRTIENLLIKIFTFGTSIFGSVAIGVRGGIEIATKTAISVVLLTQAAQFAQAVSPVASNILQTKWLKRAAEIVLDELKDSSK